MPENTHYRQAFSAPPNRTAPGTEGSLISNRFIGLSFRFGTCMKYFVCE